MKQILISMVLILILCTNIYAATVVNNQGTFEFTSKKQGLSLSQQIFVPSNIIVGKETNIEFFGKFLCEKTQQPITAHLKIFFKPKNQLSEKIVDMVNNQELYCGQFNQLNAKFTPTKSGEYQIMWLAWDKNKNILDIESQGQISQGESTSFTIQEGTSGAQCQYKNSCDPQWSESGSIYDGSLRVGIKEQRTCYSSTCGTSTQLRVTCTAKGYHTEGSSCIKDATPVCAQDTQQCSDGTFVSRDPQNCQFKQCTSPQETLGAWVAENNICIYKPTVSSSMGFATEELCKQAIVPLKCSNDKTLQCGDKTYTPLKCVSGDYIATNEPSKCPEDSKNLGILYGLIGLVGVLAAGVIIKFKMGR